MKKLFTIMILSVFTMSSAYAATTDYHEITPEKGEAFVEEFTSIYGAISRTGVEYTAYVDKDTIGELKGDDDNDVICFYLGIANTDQTTGSIGSQELTVDVVEQHNYNRLTSTPVSANDVNVDRFKKQFNRKLDAFCYNEIEIRESLLPGDQKDIRLQLGFEENQNGVVLVLDNGTVYRETSFQPVQ